MELSQLRYFAAVAELGSMSRAADRLRITQPAISRQIKNLERSLGRSLLIRHDRGVHLTEAGLALRAGLCPLLSGLDELLHSVRSGATGEQRSLRIGLFHIAQWYPFIAEALDRFRRRHPGILVEGAQIPSRLQVDALRSGEVDIVIGVPFLGLPTDVEQSGLLELRHGVVMSREHPLTKPDHLRFADLRDYSLMGYSRSTWPESVEKLLEEGRKRGVALSFAESFDNATLLLSRVAATQGIALLPEPGPLAPMENLLFRKIEDFDMPIPIAACWLETCENPAVPAFIDELRQSG